MPRPLAPHGTKGAYERHKRAHDRVCDACQAWKDGERNDTAPKATKTAKRDRPLTLDEVDFVKETLASLKLVRGALIVAPTSQISSLTKRKSELLKELKEYQDEAGKKPDAVDPLDAALGGGIDMSNVTPIAG